MRTFMAIASLAAIAAFFTAGPAMAAPPGQPAAQEPSGSAAAPLATRPARPGEPIHAYAFDGNDRRFLPGNVPDNRTATLFGDPPASGTVVVSTLECRAGTYGTAIFATEDGRMPGMVIGTVAGDARDAVAIPAAAVRRFYERNRVLYEHRTRTARGRR